MTLTLVARCADSGQLGAAGLLATPGVSHLVLHARAGVGAVATQAMVNPYLAYDGLDELARGHGAEPSLHVVMANDPGRHLRQCGIVDARGAAAAWTGDDVPGWAGHLAGPGLAVQGNRMAGPDALKRAREHFDAGAGLPLAERLLQSLESAADAGPDERGIASAALLVVDREAYPVCDVRSEDPPDTLAGLRRRYEELAASVLPRIEKLPTRDDPLGQLARESSEGLS